MKPNDKAYEAAIAEGKRWGKNLIRSENQIPSWKVLRQSDKQYGYDVIAEFNNHKDRDEALERLRAEAMVNAAYAAQFKSEDHKALKKAWLCYRLCEGGGAYDGPFFIKYDPYEENDYDKIEPILYYDATQFQSEDYAGLVKQLRDWGAMNYKLCDEAADALEVVLAEREAWKGRQEATAAILKQVETERDALKAENESMSQSLPLWAHKQMAANSALIERLRAERDALAARLAPVEAIENDKDDPTREYIPLPGGWEIQTKGKGSSYRLLDKKTGERHMILAGDAQFVHDFVTRMAKEINASAQVQPVAPVGDDFRRLTADEQKVFNSALRRSAKIKKPVEDKALVEIVARAICLNRASHACNCKEDGVCKAPVENLREHTEIWPQARAAIDAIRPHIEAAERERCARIAEHLNGWGSDFGKGGHAMHIAAVIRSGK